MSHVRRVRRAVLRIGGVRQFVGDRIVLHKLAPRLEQSRTEHRQHFAVRLQRGRTVALIQTVRRSRTRRPGIAGNIVESSCRYQSAKLHNLVVVHHDRGAEFFVVRVVELDRSLRSAGPQASALIVELGTLGRTARRIVLRVDREYQIVRQQRKAGFIVIRLQHGTGR